MARPCGGFPHVFEHFAVRPAEKQRIICIFCGANAVSLTDDQIATLRTKLYPPPDMNPPEKPVPKSYRDVIFSTNPYQLHTEEERIILLASISLSHHEIAKLFFMTRTAVSTTLFRLRRRMRMRTLPELVQFLMRTKELF